jgi:hypothetical protein
MQLLWVAALSALQSPEPVQLMDLDGKSPASVGELVLSGKSHREVVAIEKFRGWTFGGHYSVLLYESPLRHGEACKRLMWKATFRLPSEDWRKGTTIGLLSLEETEQVALASDEPCELVEYASLESGMAPDEGIKTLMLLRDLTDNLDAYSIECVDETESSLCRRIEISLRYSAARSIRKSGRDYIVWLSGIGKPDQIHVTLNSSGEKRARIVGKGPPPPF